MKKKGLCIISTTILVLVICVLWRLSYNNVNSKISNKPVKKYEKGETLEFEGVKYTVLETLFMDNNELKDYCGYDTIDKMVEELLLGNNRDRRWIITKIDIEEIELMEEDYDRFVIWGTNIESGGLINGVDLELYHKLNEKVFEKYEDDKLDHFQLFIPYTFVDTMVKKETMDNYKNRKYSIIFDIYPQKIELELN